MKTNKSELYKIYTQKCMAYLVIRGFKLQGVEPHKHNSSKNIFLFNKSSELEKAIKEYKQLSF